ncbi:protoporphyrinogen oxidase HemJ [Terrihabitans rhizophilus]|uniref:Protoporphyrinogen IX oxidase n=1 Tax=Terrihabitans rhizophilus TaxID=3092662 RepID=A0ABU4RRQ0_9HYPH|nr:protoporphyrinogen oxidase HemJ [Terrihabitans sp. PJ23]MDX6807533.1 protoporphyrinogen oxidase HemJ [Terrihabitans sp. PJ23]
MAEFYPWVKAFHIVAMTAWMAAMLYLPRLFVYHTGVAAGSEASETFKVMERRLLKAIATPAMALTWILGITLAVMSGAFSEGWMHAKLLFALILSGYHGFLARSTRTFAADSNTRKAGFYRILNEVPTVGLIIIVVLVVVKPF